MKGYYAQVTAVLKKHGFVLHRQGKGSHQIWKRAQISVTVPQNCKSKHTANAIMKEAKIDYKF